MLKKLHWFSLMVVDSFQSRNVWNLMLAKLKVLLLPFFTLHVILAHSQRVAITFIVIGITGESLTRLSIQLPHACRKQSKSKYCTSIIFMLFSKGKKVDIICGDLVVEKLCWHLDSNRWLSDSVILHHYPTFLKSIGPFLLEPSGSFW